MNNELKIHHFLTDDENGNIDVHQNLQDEDDSDINDLNSLLLYTKDPLTNMQIPSLLKDLKSIGINATTINFKKFVDFSKQIFENEELRNSIYSLVQPSNGSVEIYLETSDIEIVKRNFPYLSFGKLGQAVVVTNFCNPTLWHPVKFSDGNFYGKINVGPYKNRPCRILDFDCQNKRCIIITKALESILEEIKETKNLSKQIFKASFEGNTIVNGILFNGVQIVGNNTLYEVKMKNISTWSAGLTESDVRELDFSIDLHSKSNIFNSQKNEEYIDNNDILYEALIIHESPLALETREKGKTKIMEEESEYQSSEQEQYLTQLTSKGTTKEIIDILWADYRSICSKQLYPASFDSHSFSNIEAKKLIINFQKNIEILKERKVRLSKLLYVLEKLPSRNPDRELVENCRKLKPKVMRQNKNNSAALVKNVAYIEDLKKRIEFLEVVSIGDDNKSDISKISESDDATEEKLLAHIRKLEKDHQDLLKCCELTVCDLATLPSGLPVLVTKVFSDGYEVLTTTNVKMRTDKQTVRKEESDGTVYDKRGARVLPKDQCLADGIDGKVSVVQTSHGNAFCEFYEPGGISYVCFPGSSLYDLYKSC